MTPGFTLEVVPLGLRLAAAANRLAHARDPLFGWLAPLAAVLERAADAPLARPERFARVEATGLRRGGALDFAQPERETVDPPQDLPSDVRERLLPHVGEAARELRVHDGEHADRVARLHRADAVAFGPDVYFARGRYQPREPSGFALLAHEAVHVRQASRPDAGWQRASAHGLAVEEATADAIERAAQRRRPISLSAGLGEPAGHALPPVNAPVPAGVAPPAQRPMAASVDRNLELAAAAPAIDVESLRQGLMRELMSQIRADMERGG